MKYTLPILTAITWLSLTPTAGAQSPPGEPTITDGQQLVERASREVAFQGDVAARLRHRVDLFGHQLVGSGIYLQLHDGRQLRFRMDLKLQVGEQLTTSMQQVCDGRFLWIRRDFGGQKTLHRIDLKRVSEARALQPGLQTDVAEFWWTAVGGLPALLEQLHQRFQFGPARAGQLENVPVWTVEGRWNNDRLLASRDDGKKSGTNETRTPPGPVPDTVSLVLGRDEQLPLFPYRIEFRRKAASASARSAASPTGGTVVVVELFEVQRNAGLDPRQFVYEPGEQKLSDYTDEFLSRLGAGRN